MDTDERRTATAEPGSAGESSARQDVPAPRGSRTAAPSRPERGGGPEQEDIGAHPLWTDEPHGTRRMADPVRTAAVRAVIVASVTLTLAMTAFLLTLTDSWLAFPAVLASVGGTVVATWAVLDVWVTRQVWNQRNGVVSVPSSTARQLRRERRRERKAARTAARTAARIRRRGAGSLSEA
ncbi:hypothetical protein [Streptomyces genisteinicus]|uniref:Uncharacterized protein n=1 Tax=Streptomyces genisteinicus TaxID=2768068 RepID=A0A7H0HNX6_9ACTN|nr:hypothetical protein [Streptomyces genisteinicus]QNP62242.1 hypothetical protein IAG43_04385 [Streptomyces genisteinicus]